MYDTHHTEQSDIVEIYIQTIRFIRTYYKVILSFAIAGIIFGFFYFKFTTPHYHTFFITENGKLTADLIKSASLIDTLKNRTTLNQTQFKAYTKALRNIDKLIADTTNKNSIVFLIDYHNPIDNQSLQKAVLELFSNNIAVQTFIADKKKMLSQQLQEVNVFLSAFKSAISTTDTLNNTLRLKLLNQNLDKLIALKTQTIENLDAIGRFTILTPITSPQRELTLTKSIVFSLILFLIFGISVSTLMDLNARAKKRLKN